MAIYKIQKVKYIKTRSPIMCIQAFKTAKSDTCLAILFKVLFYRRSSDTKLIWVKLIVLGMVLQTENTANTLDFVYSIFVTF